MRFDCVYGFVLFACGRSNERPYGLVRIACGLVRGRHKARPLQWRWIGARPAQGAATTTGDGLV
ncbi:MAG: hypothetical protein SPL43_08375 [Prevotella sp.]|nr:hypothetical protein [Prevotella sp.]